MTPMPAVVTAFNLVGAIAGRGGKDIGFAVDI